MSDLDVPWAIQSLNQFIRSSDRVAITTPGVIGTTFRDSDTVISERAYVAEQILDRVLPAWRSGENSSIKANAQKIRWNSLREWAGRAIAALERDSELREKLGDTAPRLSAGEFHPWIWSGASSLWQSGHYREAVEVAIRKLNAETQNKIGRRDISGVDLFNQAFNDKDPQSGKPRLWRMKNDQSDTFKSMQRGARAFAEGIFAGIRNPFAHEAEGEICRQEALEYLAALSVLARWVDESEIVSSD